MVGVCKMGGAKKKGLAQMEKSQKMKEEKERTSKKKVKGVVEKKIATVGLPKFDDKELIPEIAKMKAITPFAVASRYNVRVSVAKDFLEELSKRGIIELVNSCSRLKIYRMNAAAS
jgi:small subunit ribosomal protein S25e